jgi:hypothetical protein
MRNVRYVAIVWLLTLSVTASMTAPDMVGKAWGQSFGIIAGTVEKTDHSRGLAVRSQPSESSSAVGYLPVGTEIRACNDFKGQWARLQRPFPNGWVNMANLKPKGGQATVVAVDQPDQCLIVRKGPDASHDKADCVPMGRQLQLSGIWSENNFARLDNGGWVDASKISTDLMTCTLPPLAAAPEAVVPPPATEPYPQYSPPSGGQSYTYAPSYNYGDYGVPSYFGPYGAFGFYPGWFPGVAVVIGNGFRGHFGRFPYRHSGQYWRHHWNGSHRSNAAVNNRGAFHGNRAAFSRNSAAINNFARTNARTFNNFRSGNTTFNRSLSNSGFRTNAFRGFRSGGGSRAMSFRGGGARAMSFHGGGGGRGGGHRR